MDSFRVNSFAIAAVYFLTAVAANSPSGPLQEPSSANASQNREVVEQVKEKVAETADIVKDKAKEIGQTLDQSQSVADVSNSILNPIYQAAEAAGEYPAFYWCAFALMTAGVISFALQLVLSKLFLLLRMHLNLKEIIMDVVGLLISAIGLVLTTQAAAENSASFVQSPSAVLSAATVGAILGIVFYVWGQRQEFQAAEGYAAARNAKEA